MTLAILVASSGRPTLARTLESISSQMVPGDELLVDVNDDAPWGHAARNRLMPRAQGEALLFMDDDDMYAPGALAAIREHALHDPDRMHVFRMRYSDGRLLWQSEKLECGNVSTQMVCVPRQVVTSEARWGDRYEGDWDFIAAAADFLGTEPVWHREVAALVRPT